MEKLWGRSISVPFDQRAGDYGSVLQHILQVDQIAVVHMLCEIIRIMEVDQSVVVCVNNILGQQDTVCDISGNLAGHIITLGGIDHGIFVGIFLLCLFVVALDQA